jgi:rhamnosyltransferase subunit B
VYKVLDDKAREWGAYDPDRHPLFDQALSEHGTIALFPQQLMRQPLPDDLPGQPLDFAGFVRFDGDQQGLSADLLAFLDEGPAPLVFTLGASAAFKAADCYQHWSQLCVELGVRAVFLCADQDLRGPCPPTQRVVPWVSVRALFARAAGVINAGGIGTCGQAALAGIPQLIVPLAFDQPDNAFRMKRLGTSLVLLPNKARGETMVRALKQLLEDDLLRARAQQLPAQLGSRCGAEVAARWIDARLKREWLAKDLGGSATDAQYG